MLSSRIPRFESSFPRTDDKTAQDHGLFEYFCGLVMNKLRKKLPNFVYTLGAFKCFPIETASDMSTFCTAQESTVYHIVQERIEGPTLDEWLRRSPSAEGLYSILLQLAFALGKAQDKKGFIHNALYASNVIIRPSQLTVITYQFGSQVFTMTPVKGEIPTIIDFSSARVTHKGFGVSFISNPTIFMAGRDLCKLITSVLAHLNKSEIYAEIQWLNEYFHNFYDVSSGDYAELVSKYHGFNLPEDSPLASLTPMDFINWFRTTHGEIFNRLVKTEAREIRVFQLLTSLRPKIEVEPDLLVIPSATMKTFAYTQYGDKYKPSTEEHEYDTRLLARYEEFAIEISSAHIYTVNYKFPFQLQYDGSKRIDYFRTLDEIKTAKEIADNYIIFARYAKTVSSPIESVIPAASIQKVFTAKEKYRYDIHTISNLPLYRLYELAIDISTRNDYWRNNHGVS